MGSLIIFGEALFTILALKIGCETPLSFPHIEGKYGEVS